MRDFIEQYVGPMVLKPIGEIERKGTTLAVAGAALEHPPTGDEKEPLHAGRVKQSIAGARSLPLHIRPAFWGRFMAAA